MLSNLLVRIIKRCTNRPHKLLRHIEIKNARTDNTLSLIPVFPIATALVATYMIGLGNGLITWPETVRT